MKRFYQTLLLCLVIPLWTHAQSDTTQTTPGKFTLDQCIQYAMDHTVELQNARVDEKISESKVKETIGIGLPQIDASVGLVHNPSLPRMFGKNTNSQDGGFSFFNNQAGEGDVVASQNFFQLPNSGDAKITINQLIFSSSYLVGLKASATYKELAYRTTTQTSIDVIEKVTKAYYAVLVNNERITLFDNNINRVDSLLKTTKALNQNGFAEAIDVDRIQVTLNNLKSEKLKFINLQNLSLSLLKYQMNYPMGEPLTLEGDLASLKGDQTFLETYKEGWDYSNRIEFQLLETQRKLQELNIKNQYSHSMPSLVAFANLGFQTQSDNFGGLFTTNTTMSENAAAAIGPDKWYSYSQVGVSLSIPLFSGLQRTHQVQQAKLSLLKIRNSETSLKQGIDLSIDQNSAVYKNALETLKSQSENMELADKVARVTKIKYEQGVGSNIEVIDAESSLRESQVNYYNALYDAIVSRVDLEKAYGKIDPTKYNVSETKK